MKKKKEDTENTNNTESTTFPVIGIGASAGGLEALKKFFTGIKENSGMTYIVVMHMQPEQPSVLADLLQNKTKIPVNFAEEGMPVEPDHVYIINPGRDITINGGIINLPRRSDRGPHHPIDLFFRSLAGELGQYSAGIILSGTGTDGSLGVKEIKNKEGLVIVQSPETAQYNGMPGSAIDTLIVDKVLSPEEMPALLDDYFSGITVENKKRHESFKKSEDKWFNRILSILKAETGHDFSNYKKNTIVRRINRRISLNQFTNTQDYLEYIRNDEREVDILFRDMLIGVTRFFRDKKAFAVLKDDILPRLIRNIPDGGNLRVWVPGCSTGEEVYSIAMILYEYLDAHPGRFNIQMFGSDIDMNAIKKAREGKYPSNISVDISPERLKRFFTRDGDYYRIRSEIRDSIVFSIHNVLKDPPFLRLNLLSCRNLLIYLDTSAQKKILPLFHYSLAPEGILMLGSSESIGQFTDMFQTLHSKWKIFKRKEVPESLRRNIEFPTGITRQDIHQENAGQEGQEKGPDLGTLTKDKILELVTPPSVLVDNRGTILHVQGRTGKYLEATSGPPTHNIVDLAREGLRFELSSMLNEASSSDKRISRNRIPVKTDDTTRVINLHVCPLKSPRELEGRYLVVFEEIEYEEAVSIDEESRVSFNGEKKIEALEHELQTTRENHQSTIEELESANEELKSTNEELQSSNEELQSTNEELESSKEEMQSLNEELQTVNAELQNKVEELSTAHDDMNNLLNSIHIGTIFVDSNLCIKRFTSQATSFVSLIDSDIGRPLENMSTTLKQDTLIEDIKKVISNLAPLEKEIQRKDDTWFLMRIIPYRTTDNGVDGVVVTFINIDDQKKAQRHLEELSREKEKAHIQILRRVFDMNPMPLAVLDSEGRIIISNTSFDQLMKIRVSEPGGINIFALDNEVLSHTSLDEKLKTALEKDRDFQTEKFAIEHKKETKTMRINGQIINYGEKKPYRILLLFEDTAAAEIKT
ncbi:MAG: chemotaxis protein CheB [Spirochaetota bacterium]